MEDDEKIPDSCIQSLNTVCTVCPKYHIRPYSGYRTVGECSMNYWVTQYMWNWVDSEDV